ncbi:hypothetical protein GCM10009759_45370 [Kitasatospora saccharophila]|uniref:Carrier domain-containing protein n=2 Tax=Kitasatospora saccharophila TaxID=407973 RepID=A0ABN2XBG3_9ACTN
MTVAEPRPAADDVPSRIPSGAPAGGACPPDRECPSVRRTLHLTGPARTVLPADAPELLPAALLLLARKYSGSEEFRVGVRWAGRPAGGPAASVTASMPAALTVAGHRAAVSEGLRRAAAGPAEGDGPAPALLCVPDGPAEGRHGAELAVSWEATPQGTAVHADFHEHVHGAPFVGRLLGHLENLLGQLTGTPDRAVGELTLLTDAERERLRVLNDTARPYPRDASVYGLFAEQVASGPDRPAVSHGDLTLSYRELDEQALALAGRLRAAGVGRHDRVALSLAKTPLLLVAVLAVLRLGATYVPLSPGLPVSRRDFLLADSGAVLLLVDGPTPTDPGVPLLDLAAPVAGPGPSGSAPELPDVDSLPRDGAYVMYTSGTTGRPKGVLVGHRAVIRLVRGTDYVALSSGTRLLQTGATAFDATTFEFWGALLNGGSIVLVPEPTVLSAPDLGAAIRRHGVNTLFLTTALFHQIVEQDPSVLDGCQVVVGGDALSARHAERAVRSCPGSVFVNGYGPTENTTFSTAHRVGGAYPGRVPIGRPISNSTAYVLDLDGRAQPVGVPGELHVGGDGLSDGYLNRPEQNGSSFITGRPDAPGRLYRTGDTVQWTEDGELDFVGRTDQQVKVRGFRVEPAEVEAQLSRIPALREAVVLPQRRADGVVLAACFTADRPLSGEELRRALLAELPDYLVPSSFTQLDAMPLTPNQKIDRAALADLATPSGGGATGRRRAPGTALEATVAAVFAEVLGVESVSVDDDFFAMGGHSLLATRLWSRLRSVLDTEFALRQVLDTPTAAGLAAALEQRTEAAAPRPRLVRKP